MPKQWGYPEGRARAGAPAPAGETHYERQQNTSGFVTLGDTLADVIRFAGVPDAIEVMVEQQDAVLAITDRLARDEDLITLRAGQSQNLQLRGDVIRARNATAGLAARVQVIGLWLRR